jgi:hypothetical protein
VLEVDAEQVMFQADPAVEEAKEDYEESKALLIPNTGSDYGERLE